MEHLADFLNVATPLALAASCVALSCLHQSQNKRLANVKAGVDDLYKGMARTVSKADMMSVCGGLRKDIETLQNGHGAVRELLARLPDSEVLRRAVERINAVDLEKIRLGQALAMSINDLIAKVNNLQTQINELTSSVQVNLKVVDTENRVFLLNLLLTDVKERASQAVSLRRFFEQEIANLTNPEELDPK